MTLQSKMKVSVSLIVVIFLFHYGKTQDDLEETSGIQILENKQIDVYRCDMSMQTGPCRGAFRRYFYDNSTQSCRLFIYGGCKGNHNRFITKEICEEVCMGIVLDNSEEMKMLARGKVIEKEENLENISSIIPEKLKDEGENILDFKGDYEDINKIESIQENNEEVEEEELIEATTNADVPVEEEEVTQAVRSGELLGDKCPQSDPCIGGAFCVWYDELRDCDCSQKDTCSVPEKQTLTLKGDTYIRHAFHHNSFQNIVSTDTRLTIEFTTRAEEGSLFYGSSEDTESHLRVFLRSGKVNVEVKFDQDANTGEAETLAIETEDKVDDGATHKFQIVQQNYSVMVVLDGQEEIHSMTSLKPVLTLGPDVKLGGGGDSSNFVGCLSELHFNHQNVLQFLHSELPGSRLEGGYLPDWGECDLVQTLEEITITDTEYHYQVMVEKLDIDFEFEFLIAERTENVVVARVPMRTHDGADAGLKVIWLGNSEENTQQRKRRDAGVSYFLDILLDQAEDSTSLASIPRLEHEALNWQYIKLHQTANSIRVEVGPVNPTQNEITLENPVYLKGNIFFGKSATESEEKRPDFCTRGQGMTQLRMCNNHNSTWIFNEDEKACEELTFGGCTAAEGVFETMEECHKICGKASRLKIRDVHVNSSPVPPSSLLPVPLPEATSPPSMEILDKEIRKKPPVSMAKCTQGLCRHGGRCSNTQEGFHCDCAGTGYVGKTCAFAEFRRSCEEIRQLGIYKNGVYIIDMDGEGPFPPLHVRCEFDSRKQTATTVVEHNLRPKTDMRGEHIKDVRFHLEYREFTGSMIEALMERSDSCEQQVRIDCYKTVLDMKHLTWFKALNHDSFIKSLGSSTDGFCPCGERRKCIDKNVHCNCDAGVRGWKNDVAVFHRQEQLPITDVILMQPANRTGEDHAQITIHPLRCRDKKIFTKEASFHTEASYLTVPVPGHAQELKFSFRTVATRGILLSQTPATSSEKFVAIHGENQLLFHLRFKTQEPLEHLMEVQHSLSDGQWHFVRIDYVLEGAQEVRFTIDSEESVVELPAKEHFLSGDLHLGNLPQNQGGLPGLVGCIKDVQFGGKILSMKVDPGNTDVSEGCTKTCTEDFCKNNGVCIERWGTAECVCENPDTDRGRYCETSTRREAITMITAESFIESLMELPEHINETKPILKEDLSISFQTSERSAIIFYVRDEFNNFVQLSIEPEDNKDKVVFRYNSGEKIAEVHVEGDDYTYGKLVHVEILRNESWTTLIVNGKTSQVQEPLLQLDTYSRNPFPDFEESVIPGRGPLTSFPFIQFLIGGLGQSAKSSVPGFIGCLSGFQFAENLIQLSMLAKDEIGGDIVEGCQTKCTMDTCHNDGICKEDFTRQHYTCDCSDTYFVGSLCDQDVGGHFSGNGGLIYEPTEEPIGGGVTGVKVKGAFSSDELPGSDALMILYKPQLPSEDYILAAVTPEGHIKIEVEQNDVLYTGTSAINAADGYRHSLYIEARVNNTPATMVDGEHVLLLVVPSVKQDRKIQPIHFTEGPETEIAEDEEPALDLPEVDNDLEVAPMDVQEAEDSSITEEAQVEEQQDPLDENQSDTAAGVDIDGENISEGTGEENEVPNEGTEEELASRRKRQTEEEEKGKEGGDSFYIAGTWTNDPRFVHLSMFKGCIANVAVRIRDKYVRPEESYFKYGQEEVQVTANDEMEITEGSCKTAWVPPVVLPFRKPDYTKMVGSAWNAEEVKSVPFQRATTSEHHAENFDDENEDEDDDEGSDAEQDSGSVMLIVGVVVVVALIIGAICLARNRDGCRLLKKKSKKSTIEKTNLENEKNNDDGNKPRMFSGDLVKDAEGEPMLAVEEGTPGKYKQISDDSEKETAPLLDTTLPTSHPPLRPKSEEIPQSPRPKSEEMQPVFPDPTDLRPNSRSVSQEMPPYYPQKPQTQTPPPSPSSGMHVRAPMGTISEVTLSPYPKDSMFNSPYAPVPESPNSIPARNNV